MRSSHPFSSADLRFLSIDFLNTFLLTYRVFTDGETVLNALKRVFYDPPDPESTCEQPTGDLLDIPGNFDGRQSPRRTSAASSVSGYCSEGADRDRSMSSDSTGMRFRGSGVRRMLQQQSTQEEGLSWIPECGGPIIVHEEHQHEEYEKEEQEKREMSVPAEGPGNLLAPPNTVAASSSSDTLTGM